jgi:hypothetical protein
MIGRGNRSTRRKPAPVLLCPPQTPHAVRTRTRDAAVEIMLLHLAFQRSLPLCVPEKSFSSFSSSLAFPCIRSFNIFVSIFRKFSKLFNNLNA